MNTPNFRPSTESSVIVDERRHQIVNSRSMSLQQSRALSKSFRNFRPDMNYYDEHSFMMNLYVGENYLEHMKQKLNKELQRMCLQTPPSCRPYKSALFEKPMLQLGHPFTRAGRVGTNRTWQESCSLVNYIDLIKSKVHKYGLAFPLLQRNIDKAECLRQEAQITANLFSEMTKPPMRTIE